MIDTAPLDAERLHHALAGVERLLRNETNRARHITLTGIRADIAEALAHMGSQTDVVQPAA